MLTRRGWMLGFGCIGLLLLGRILGLIELYLVSTAGLVALAGASFYVRTTTVELRAARHVRPPRAHFGVPARVDLEITNPTGRRSPELLVEEPFDNGRLTARLLVPPLDEWQRAKASYRLPTDRRGRFVIGPLTLQVEDPFGLAVRAVEAVASTTATVYPRFDDVPGLPAAPGQDPQAGSIQRAARAQGEEFYALRPYELGDDLRRVHWPSTARSGELMIRQLEVPWQHRATVLLDVRRAVHTPESFELAVSIAASIATGSHRDRATMRVMTTAGVDSGFGLGQAHWEATLALLATARMTGAANLTSTLASLRHNGAGSAVAVVTTSVAARRELEAVAHLRERVGVIMLVLIERSAYVPSATDPANSPRVASGIGLVRVTGSQPFATAWSADPRIARQHNPRRQARSVGQARPAATARPS
jgi:uncharacterized protein (DUF58 family)